MRSITLCAGAGVFLGRQKGNDLAGDLLSNLDSGRDDRASFRRCRAVGTGVGVDSLALAHFRTGAHWENEQLQFGASQLWFIKVREIDLWSAQRPMLCEEEGPSVLPLQNIEQDGSVNGAVWWEEPRALDEYLRVYKKFRGGPVPIPGQTRTEKAAEFERAKKAEEKQAAKVAKAAARARERRQSGTGGGRDQWLTCNLWAESSRTIAGNRHVEQEPRGPPSGSQTVHKNSKRVAPASHSQSFEPFLAVQPLISARSGSHWVAPVQPVYFQQWCEKAQPK
ncbi:hypothetical protein DFH08DRAFT_796887 [Mycena albidolilacea]|uniref:Uncharacterized protein n=1 Tax=Mycena albidolilacea TaxID=1033008 RepID=A0AAD7AWC0_9AGAR|nr:hypothetical protein DFH08DRAFT_796887 [Mycena albidolilacea]